MSLPTPRPIIFGLLVILLLWGCYAQGGAPTDHGPDDWERLANDACIRGDHSAYKTLIQRAGRPVDHQQCPPASPDS